MESVFLNSFYSELEKDASWTALGKVVGSGLKSAWKSGVGKGIVPRAKQTFQSGVKAFKGAPEGKKIIGKITGIGKKIKEQGWAMKNDIDMTRSSIKNYW